MKTQNCIAWGILVAASAVMSACNNDSAEPTPALVEETPDGLVQSSVVATFGRDKFLEGIAFDKAGTLYVSQISDGQVIAVAPDGKSSVLASLPMGKSAFAGGKGSMGNLAYGNDGNLYIGVNNSIEAAVHGIWQLNPTTKQNLLYAALPLEANANGIAFDANGDLFFADTPGGAIWKINAGERKAAVWLRDTSFTSPVPGIPAINGLQIAKNTVYVTVPGKGYLIAIPEQANGQPGSPAIVRRNVSGDDFAIDREGNLFVTTHPFNTVEKISSDFRTSRIIATPANGVIGAAAAAFGVLPGDTGNLYVVTDGGFYGFAPDRPRGAANVVKLRVYKN